MVGRFKKMASVAAGVAFAAVTAGCGAGNTGGDTGSNTDDSGRPIKVMTHPYQAMRLPAVVGDAQGHFEDEGISVEFVDQPGGLSAFQALKSTGSQLTQIDDAGLVASWQAGAKLKVACGQQTRMLLSVVAPAGNTLDSVEEGADWRDVLQQLEDKVVGSPVPEGSGFYKFIEALFEEASVDTDSVTFVNVGAATPQVAAALEHGQVDAAITLPTGTQHLQESGTAVELMYLPETDSIFSTLHAAVWVGEPDWIDSNSETVKAFCAGIQTASEFTHEESNVDTLVPIMMEDMKLTASVAKRVLEDGVYDTYTTELTRAEWGQTVKGLIKAGTIESSPIPAYDELFASPG